MGLEVGAGAAPSAAVSASSGTGPEAATAVGFTVDGRPGGGFNAPRLRCSNSSLATCKSRLSATAPSAAAKRVLSWSAGAHVFAPQLRPRTPQRASDAGIELVTRPRDRLPGNGPLPSPDHRGLSALTFSSPGTANTSPTPNSVPTSRQFVGH